MPYLIYFFIVIIFSVNNIFANDKNNTVKFESSATGDGEDLNASIKNSLLNIGGQKLTPSPNESIDLYTGTLKLHYVDFSTPIAPGLNLELHRIYDSTIYNYVNYPQVAGIWMYDINLPSWTLSTSYILERFNDTCSLANDPCDQIVVNTNGSSEALRRDSSNTKIYSSKNGSVYNENTKVLTDKRGFKYYFSHRLVVIGGWRNYLTKIETPDGKHWVSYHYNEHYLAKIASSDARKTININYSRIDFHKHKQGNWYLMEPTSITFNGKEVVRYGYTFYDHGHRSFGRMALTGVVKANGDNMSYAYEFLNLRKRHEEKVPSNWRLLLSSVAYSNGESAGYYYTEDVDNNIHKYLKNFRIGTIIHNTNYKFNQYEASNTWAITQSIDSYNGIGRKIISVVGPYHSTKTIFSYASNGHIWRAGMPLEHYIYKDKAIYDSNIFQSEFYTWGQKLFSSKYQYLSSSIAEAGYDTKTYKPLLKSKQITRYNNGGADIYNAEINSYDEYDNPLQITLSGNGGTKIINQSFENNTTRNILGLQTSFAVNNKVLLKQEYRRDMILKPINRY
jgi:hypothetical protein